MAATLDAREGNPGKTGHERALRAQTSPAARNKARRKRSFPQFGPKSAHGEAGFGSKTVAFCKHRSGQVVGKLLVRVYSQLRIKGPKIEFLGQFAVFRAGNNCLCEILEK